MQICTAHHDLHLYLCLCFSFIVCSFLCCRLSSVFDVSPFFFSLSLFILLSLSVSPSSFHHFIRSSSCVGLSLFVCSCFVLSAPPRRGHNADRPARCVVTHIIWCARGADRSWAKGGEVTCWGVTRRLESHVPREVSIRQIANQYERRYVSSNVARPT